MPILPRTSLFSFRNKNTRRLNNPLWHFIRHSCLWTLVLCFTVRPIPLQSQKPAVAAGSDAPFELVIKQGLPLLGIQKTVYSADEHYAALNNAALIIVYDLTQAQELRRIPLKHPGLFADTAILAFAHTRHILYVRDGPSLLACDLDSASECKSLQSNLGSPFIVSSDDLIAYVTALNIPLLLDPTRNRILKVLPDTVPTVDKNDFSWSSLAFDEKGGHPVKLAMAGEIDRPVPTTRRGHTETREDWHMSLFDLQTSTAANPYTELPLAVDQSDFDLNGNPLFCGIAGKDADADNPPNTVYSPAQHDFLSSSDVKESVPQSIEDCVNGNTVVNVFGLPSPPDISPESAFQFGTLSPKKDLVLYTQANATFQNILYLGHPGSKNPPQILSGSTALSSEIEFIGNHPMISVHGTTPQVWDLTTGRVTSSSWDSHLSGDYKVSAAFVYHFENSKPKGADLWLQDNTTNKTTQTSLHVSTMPSWYRVSATGEAVIYLLTTTIGIFANGVAAEVPCESRFGQSPKPFVDATGTLLSAVCQRDEKDPSNPDPSVLGDEKSFLVRWQLPSMTELKPIPVLQSPTCASLSPDGTLALICGSSQIDVVNLSTNATSKIPLPLSFEQNIVDGQLQKDNHTVVLAIDDMINGKVEWINTTDQSKKDSITLAHITSLSSDEVGDAVALSDDGIISLFDGLGVRRARLVPLASQDWLVFSDTGFFDGTANALQWASYRLSPSSPSVPVSTLFNELYTPGLLPLLITAQVPRHADGISLSTILELPGGQLLLQSDGTVPMLLNARAVVCIGRPDLFLAVSARFGQGPNIVRDDSSHSDCPNRIVLSDQSNPQLTVKALNAIKSSRFSTIWDGQKLSSSGTVHLLTVAVGTYSHIDEPTIPTAVPAASSLESLLRSHYAGDNIVDWDQQCGGSLYDAAATKVAILGCLDKMIPNVKPEDMVVLIFAGHGGGSSTAEGQSELFNFYPSDAVTSAVGLDNVISSAELAEKFRLLQARRLVVVMDACDSGAVLPPFEGAFAARLRENFVASHSAPTSEANAQGVLLIAASVGIEDAVAGTTANPFFDRLQDVLTPKGGLSTSARDIATKMSAPLELPQQHAPSITMTPVAIQIGADFSVTKP